MNEKICCFTGHRQIPNKLAVPLMNLMEAELESLISKGYAVFRVGGALGFDTLAALAVIRARIKYPDIKLELCLPCKNQSEFWSSSQKDTYNLILGMADDIRYVGDAYTSSCMFERNRMLVNGSSFCIAFYRPNSTGGTSYTVKYAAKMNVPCLNLFNKL